MAQWGAVAPKTNIMPPPSPSPLISFPVHSPTLSCLRQYPSCHYSFVFRRKERRREECGVGTKHWHKITLDFFS